jgi:two-component system LytT family response regulator
MADYVVINKYIAGNKEKLIIHSTMKAAEKNFLNEQFARVHRSFIVNLKNVIEVNREFVVLKGEEEIPLGVTYKEDVMRNIEKL